MAQFIDLLAMGLSDGLGNWLDSGQIYTYEPGTTTKRSIFKDNAALYPYPNPATLDGCGRLFAYTTNDIKVLVVNESGTTIRTIERIRFVREFSGTDIDEEEVLGTNINPNVAGAGLIKDVSGAIKLRIDNKSLKFDDDGVLSVCGPVSEIKLSDTTGSGAGSIGTKIGHFTNATTVGEELELTQDAVYGDRVEILETGLYGFGIRWTSNTGAWGVSKNASSLTTDINSLTASEILCVHNTTGVPTTVSGCAFLQAGDIIRPHLASNPAKSFFICRILLGDER